MLTLNNGFSPILSSSKKGKLFAMNLIINPTPNDQGPALQDFSSITKHNHCDLTILFWEIFRLLKNFDSTKATGSDKIPVVSLKNLFPEISQILANFFNCCL